MQSSMDTVPKLVVSSAAWPVDVTGPGQAPAMKFGCTKRIALALATWGPCLRESSSKGAPLGRERWSLGPKTTECVMRSLQTADIMLTAASRLNWRLESWPVKHCSMASALVAKGGGGATAGAGLSMFRAEV